MAREVPTDPGPIGLTEVVTPDDPLLQPFHRIMEGTFADPNITLSLEHLQEFVAGRDGPLRRFHCLVVTVGGRVAGGSLFSYCPGANTGFSEYIVVAPEFRGLGLARMIFDRRLRALDADAQAAGRPRADALFIEVANPRKMPPDIARGDRERAMDPAERHAFMRHLGFWRCDFDYVQPPLDAGKSPVTYLDLCCLPRSPDWAARRGVPGDVVLATVEPIWASWCPGEYRLFLERLRPMLSGREVRLVPLA